MVEGTMPRTSEEFREVRALKQVRGARQQPEVVREASVSVQEESQMPFDLKDRDISSDIATVHSALIVPCRFCPAASLAVRESKPYIELFSKLLRTPSYESYIQALKSRLESEGIRTGVFDSKHQFVVCMWTSRRREDLARQAAGYDAVIVLGCDAAVETVRSCLQSSSCRVIPGMEVEGIVSVIPTLQFPFDISLEVSTVTRVLQPHVAAFPSSSQRKTM
jgi:hypothetical protein